ncbi:MAG: peptidase, partial [Burkholderiaceae bacterium]|nr:peptidase [Burkholderiaceae bacterium]
MAPAPAPTAGDSALVASPATGAALPGAENAGKPGYYTVRPGDTMIRIGLEHGLEVGQVLRVIPPEASASVVAQPVTPNAVETRPIGPGAAAPVAPPTAAAAPSAATAQPVAPTAAAPPAATSPRPAAPATRTADDDIAWTWPADGALGGSFDEARNKGIAIVGKAGDPVVAAADGRV